LNRSAYISGKYKKKDMTLYDYLVGRSFRYADPEKSNVLYTIEGLLFIEGEIWFNIKGEEGESRDPKYPDRWYPSRAWCALNKKQRKIVFE